MVRYALVFVPFLVILSVLTVATSTKTSAQPVKLGPVVKCEKSSAEYLKDAEMLQKESVRRDQNGKLYNVRKSYTLAAQTTLKFYEVCFELERYGR